MTGDSSGAQPLQIIAGLVAFVSGGLTALCIITFALGVIMAVV